MSEHKFPYKWQLKDGYPAKGIKPNGCKVFGTFICGGGSTMGYKLAGYDHLGGVEIDPKVAAVYEVNHHPKHLFVEDIRLFNKREDLPKELFDLDLLDGSPPCSSFSMAGNRDKDWGKKKQFREGQEFQRLDDLVFEYIRTIGKLRPKVALLENVKGLITGNAKAYAKQMKTDFEKLGYRVQVFLLNAASMGVPQKRERVFFIGLRNDFKLGALKLAFDEKAIRFEDFKEISGKLINNGKPCKLQTLWTKRIKSDESFSDISQRLTGKAANFTTYLVRADRTPPTLVSNSHYYTFDECRIINQNEYSSIGSFPVDYDFLGNEARYLIGMSVPPVMTAQIANQIWEQWLSKIKAKD